MKLNEYGINDAWVLLTRSTRKEMSLADALRHVIELEKRCRGRRSVRRSIYTSYNGLTIKANIWFEGNVLEIFPTWGYYYDEVTVEAVRTCMSRAIKKFNVPSTISGFSIKIR